MPAQPNGLGQFEVGVSPIGDQPFYWPDTLYSQYANSPVLTGWLDYFSQWIDANASVDQFYDDMFNVQTAQGYGLDVWGRIVGVSRVLQIVPSKFLGFKEAAETTYEDTWGYAIWYSGQAIGTSAYSLSDSAFRLLIMAKAASNIWNGSIPGLNAILRLLFPGMVAYCTDGLNGTMTYTFGWLLSPVQLSVVQSSGALPRPAGILATVVQL